MTPSISEKLYQYVAPPTITPTATPTSTPGATWQPVTSQFTARYGAGIAVTSEGQIFAIGGFSGGALTTVESYTPGNNSWDLTNTSMPSPRCELSAAYVGGLIYAIGGYSGYSPSYTTVEIYDPGLDSWTTGVDMNTPRMGAACVVYGTKIYMFGGYNYGTIYDSVEVFDTNGGTSWSYAAPMPSARWRHGAIIIGTKVYIIGGANDGYSLYPVVSVDVYDLVSNTWDTMDDVTITTSGAGFATLNNKIYIMGGFDGQNILATTYEFDPVTGVIRQLDDIDPARLCLEGAVVGQKIYAFGGGTDYSGNYTVNTLESYWP